MLVRIVLDTCTVRNEVHGTGPRLDLQAIPDCQDQLRFSLAGSAFAELLEQLCNEDGGISFPSLVEMVTTLDGHVLGRCDGESSFKAFLGASEDLLKNIHGVARVADLDGDEVG